jgi:hypothetical protein
MRLGPAQGRFAFGVERSTFGGRSLFQKATAKPKVGRAFWAQAVIGIVADERQTLNVERQTLNVERQTFPYSPASRKPSSWRMRVGWRIFRSALASI